jgi:hypothetical protein
MGDQSPTIQCQAINAVGIHPALSNGKDHCAAVTGLEKSLKGRIALINRLVGSLMQVAEGHT